MIAEPLKCLAHAPSLPKFYEHELNSLAAPPIRVKGDFAQDINSVAYRQPLEQFATARLGFLAGEHSLPYHLEFDYAKRSFDTQHQLVIEIIQIVDLLLVGNEGSEDLTHFQQSAPVFVRAG